MNEVIRLPNGEVIAQEAFVTRSEALELLDVLKRRGTVREDATL